MRTFNTQAEIDSEIKGGVFRIEDDVKITFDCKIDADVWVRNIEAKNIDLWNIKARHIDVANIDAIDIDAVNINAINLDALDINYYAYCIAYESLKCFSIKGSHPKAIHKCLENEIIIMGEKITKSRIRQNIFLTLLLRLKTIMRLLKRHHR